MEDSSMAARAGALATTNASRQWMLLLAGSALFVAGMLAAGLPGA